MVNLEGWVGNTPPPYGLGCILESKAGRVKRRFLGTAGISICKSTCTEVQKLKIKIINMLAVSFMYYKCHF